MQLSCDDSGRGPVVVLLHGFPLDRAMWANQVAALEPSYRVIVPDLRGQGASRANGIFTMDEMADDVVETLDGLEVAEPVVLGGLSMGGYVALAAMARHSTRFRGLMLIDTRAVADAPDAAANRETTARALESTGETSAVVEAMIPRLFGTATRERRPAVVEAARPLMGRSSPSGLAGALRGMALRPDRTRLLGQIAIPTLVLVGEDDQISPPSEAEAIASAIPGAHLTVIPGAGHLAPLEQPEATNAAILRFLAGLS